MDRQGPKIDPRQFSQLLGSLQQMVPHYTPEWPARDEEDAGVVLLQVFSRIAEQVVQRLNQTPDKNFVAFLDMLGISLLPARPARAPVQFRLAAGTPGNVLIPTRTQLAAETTEERPEPLPFETEQALQASASPLLSVISVDPITDRIYKPPPGFLEREFPSETLPDYTLISFSEAGSKTIQLDRVDELQEGDYLKIGQDETVDYLIIASIEGRIVTVTDALLRNYPAATSVEKITRFHLFAGKNHQAHILYLGHPDLFNVKSSARFTLNITHTAATAGLQQLLMVWEYWGEVAGQEGDDWQAFEKEPDTSQGFSKNGTITLRKPEGEIKEREINATTSRWIRCRLVQALPVREFPLLPELDAVTFVVESAGDPQPPDQAFHNDTPLDVALPFFPFGVEPRIFDGFYLASKEAFSKKNARIEIKVSVDARGILAAPAAILFTNSNGEQEIRIFARGTGGRLVEVNTGINSAIQGPKNRGVPPGTRIAHPDQHNGIDPIKCEAAPSAVASSGSIKRIWVFVRAEDGDLWELFFNEPQNPAKQPEWINNRRPPISGSQERIQIQFDPTAVVTSDGRQVFVFVVGTDGNLYQLNRNPQNTPGNWDAIPNTLGITIDASPYAAISEDNKRIKVFVTGSDGRLYEWDDKDKRWQSYQLSGERRATARPFAGIYAQGNDYYAKVFVKDRDGSLHLLDTSSPNQGDTSLDSPHPEVRVDSHPHGFMELIGANNERLHVFVRGDDNRLWEWIQPVAGGPDPADPWKPYQSPGDVELRYSPFVVYSSQAPHLSVFAGSNKNALLEAKLFNEVGGGGGPEITLSDTASEEDDSYSGLVITLKDSNINNKIIRYAGSDRKVATLESSWDTIPVGAAYEIAGIGRVQGGDLPTIILDDDASTTPDIYNGLTIQIRESDGGVTTATIEAYTGGDRKAFLDTAWSTNPDTPYTILPAVDGQVQQVTQLSVTLDANASDNDGEYVGRRIVVDTGGGGQTRTITRYSGQSKEAHLETRRWNPLPAPDTRYQIRDDSGGIVREDEIQLATQPTIRFTADASSTDNVYVGLKIRVIAPNGTRQEREITAYSGHNRTATVTQSWEPLPDQDFSYQIRGILEGIAQGGTHPTVILAQDDHATPNLYVGNQITIESADGDIQTAKILTYDHGSKRAELDTAWRQSAATSYSYRIVVHEGTARGATNAYILLTPSPDNIFYVGKEILIVGGSGQGQKNVIEHYIDQERKAIVEHRWEVGKEPDNTSKYWVRGFASWIAHHDQSSATDIRPRLSWEYWNSRGWVAFKKEQEFVDGTKDFLIDGTIEYILPDNIEPTEVAGQENYWIRARLVGGDYGKETFLLKEETQGGVKTLELVSQKDSITPPQIFSITIRYRLITHEFPQQCLTFNNLDYIDQTSACKTPDKWFAPFATLGDLEDNDKGMYLGFAQRLAGGPIRMFFAAQEISYSEQTKPVVEWRYRGENEWQRLSYEDATEGLIQQEILTLLVPQDFTRVSRFGESLFWIRGSLVQGEYSPKQLPVLSGIFPNTAWAFQAETITEEILGSSNGEANQIFQFFKALTLPTPLPLPTPSILPGELVRVRETLSGEERTVLLDKLGERAVHDITDAAGKVLETWVLWLEVLDFFNSSSDDRHYTLDRATGQLQFGDGRQGRIPPAGTDNIQAFSYQAGGGVLGNVDAGQIRTLVTAIAGVEATNNPVAADGGADTATLEEMLNIGPAMISHRDRAVTTEDFERLARDASGKVVKARCLPNTDNNGRRATGWVKVIIVPHTNDAKPQPSFALREAVRRYLQERCANHLAAPERISVSGPEYVDVDVEVTIVVDTIDVASQVETEVRENLQRFLHPLTGGLAGTGWEFGRAVPASDVYVLLERIPGVDHVEALVFRYNGNTAVDLVPVRPNALVASGRHRITIELRERR